MKMLIVAATKMEITPFLAINKNVDYLITGIGAPACIYALIKKLALQKYDLVIQAGIAGSFNKKFALGHTFYVTSDVFADVAIKENNQLLTLFETGFANLNDAPYTNGKLVNTFKNNFGLLPANAITVNTITDDTSQNEMNKNKYDAEIESMEGAALHYVCLQENVPFLQIRSISNFVGERIKTNWKMKEAVEGLNEVLMRVVEELGNVERVGKVEREG